MGLVDKLKLLTGIGREHPEIFSERKMWLWPLYSISKGIQGIKYYRTTPRKDLSDKKEDEERWMNTIGRIYAGVCVEALRWGGTSLAIYGICHSLSQNT